MQIIVGLEKYMKNLVGIVVSIIYIVLVFILSKFMTKKGEEASRKFIHILISNVWIIYCIFIDLLWVASILPVVFIIINSLSYKFKIFKTMEREKNDGFGTIYYAISIFIITIFSYLQQDPMIGTAGMLIMGYGDGFAAIVGRKVKSKEYNILGTTKTIAGSATMFIFSLIISCIVFYIIGMEYFIIKAFITSVIATLLEAISVKGLDNINVPIMVTILTYIFI